MRRFESCRRRVVALERWRGDGPPSGIEHVDPESTAEWWREWDGDTAPAVGVGVAHLSPETTVSEWAAKYEEILMDEEEV